MHRHAAFLLLSILLTGSQVYAQSRSLDHFETVSDWRAIPSDGVRMAIRSAPGVQGKCMAVDFEFHAGSGYAIAQRDMPLDLPDNYKFSFYLRGETPTNNFEFKLLDSLGNVYWIKKLNIEYPSSWKKTAVKKRHLSFAWGPSGAGEIRKVSKLEFVVSAGTGGKGTIYVDELTFEPMADSLPAGTAPLVTASSSSKDGRAEAAVDGNPKTAWRSTPGGKGEWLRIAFPAVRELGGLVIDWRDSMHAIDYNVDLSDDGKEWTTAYRARNGNGGRDYISLSESEARFIRLSLLRPASRRGYAIAEIAVKGPEFSTDPNAFFTAIASESPAGNYPRYLLRQQSYWTVVGSGGDTKEALINEDGQIEVDKSSFSLEPFLFVNGQFITWHDVAREQTLDRGYLPIPEVRWSHPLAGLSVRAFATGGPDSSILLASYRVRNPGSTSIHGNLFIALRPFQVNPPWQGLNAYGGWASVRSIDDSNGVALVKGVPGKVGTRRVIPLNPPSRFGAASFDEGDIAEILRAGKFPRSTHVRDSLGYASGAYAFTFNLAPGDSIDFSFAVPFHDWLGTLSSGPPANVTRYVEDALHATQEYWESRVGNVRVVLPPSADPVIRTLKSNLAYILINRDGPAIQPGSRSYERAWIRDGSLTSTALLQTGNTREVREYLDWYAPHQYPSGKVPCVVDARGADPVPEHDSNGELIYALRQYFLFTGDTLWLRGKLPYVVNAVRYIKSLRAERMTDEYRTGTPEQRACFGLVPESISHEGYSDKPMHSYWDDFFILRGLKDAAEIARVLGESTLQKEFENQRDDFRECLYASMRLAMKTKKIDFIPGCVELGDFDATSTTIGISPGGELGNIPEPALTNTFERYYKFFTDRRDGVQPWRNYTPYEVRLIGAFVYLGWTERAHELLNFFMHDRRPQGWNHWAEVVWPDPRTPKFIGDMPHTWVGSDFVRSIRSMFVYERERDTALVIAAGIPQSWVDDPAGIAVSALPTYYGNLDYTMRKSGENVIVEIGGNVAVPPGGIVLVSPMGRPVKAVKGSAVRGQKNGEIIVRSLPSRLVLEF